MYCSGAFVSDFNVEKPWHLPYHAMGKEGHQTFEKCVKI